MRLLVIDAEPPWVRSLFFAVAKHAQVDFLNIHNVRCYHMGWWPGVTFADMLRWKRLGESTREGHLFVPTRLRRMSCAMVWAYCRLIYADTGMPDAVVFTGPTYAAYFAAFHGIPKVYYAHDPFRYYPANRPHVIDHWEGQMLDGCDLAFAVSNQLRDDFRVKCNAPVIYCPNAVSEELLTAVSSPAPAPNDLPVGQPIVGCVGNMNNSYDWELINNVAVANPDLNFVFVGPVAEVDEEAHRKIMATLSLRNVTWLGSRPRERLAAYLQHFDVCASYMRLNEQNHRRSPLRLFDYLATDKPIVTTALQEAYQHQEFLSIARDAAEFSTLLRVAVGGADLSALPARRRYIRANTWHRRAEMLLEHVKATCFRPNRRAALGQELAPALAELTPTREL